MIMRWVGKWQITQQAIKMLQNAGENRQQTGIGSDDDAMKTSAQVDSGNTDDQGQMNARDNNGTGRDTSDEALQTDLTVSETSTLHTESGSDVTETSGDGRIDQEAVEVARAERDC